MVIGIDHPHTTHSGNYVPYVAVCGPQGPIFKYKGACCFLATKEPTWLWFGVVIGIDHPHTHCGNCVSHVSVCGPQGPILKYKGPAYSYQLRQPLDSGVVWW